MQHRASTQFALLGYLIILCASIGILALYWIGYRGYPDEIFLIRGALGWLENLPYIGSTHWELRHPYVLATAASVGLFGISEWSLLLPNILALLMLVTGVYWIGTLLSGAVFGTVTAILLVSVPIITETATTLMPDLFEALFVFTSLGLFLGAFKSERPALPLVLAGVFAGLAFITRETSITLLLLYSVAFLLAYKARRSQYLWLLAGFFPVWLLEVVFLASQTGDPLYRYVIDFVQYHPPSNFDLLSPPLDNPSEAQFAYDKISGEHALPSGGGDIHPPGPIDLGRTLNPFVYLFVNHEYGLTWLFGVPALAIALPGIRAPSRSQQTIAVIAILAILWFVVISYLLGMRPNPRYFLVPLIAAIIVTGFLLAKLWRRGARTTAAGLAAALVCANLMATDLRTPRAHAEREFISYSEKTAEVVHTRPAVAKIINALADLNGKKILLDTTPPAEGDLFLYVPRRYGRDAKVDKGYLPTSQWQTVKVFGQRERFAGKLLRLTTLSRLLPKSLSQTLRFPEPEGKLLRVGAISTTN